MTTRRSVVLAVVLVVAALAAFALLGGHESGLDCEDPVWGETPMAERDTVYAALGGDVRLALGALLLVGSIGLGAVVVRSPRGEQRDSVVALATTLVIVAACFAATFWIYSCPA